MRASGRPRCGHARGRRSPGALLLGLRAVTEVRCHMRRTSSLDAIYQRQHHHPPEATPHKTVSPLLFRAARSSVEGLNQEIERLVFCPALDPQKQNHKITPEGHRAPLAELLRRSVNTQTPALHDRQSHSAHSSGGSVCSSPDLDANRLGTSPHINRFLAREPPDGCEKVNLKFTENIPGCTKTIGDLSPIKPSVGFQLRPSSGSAFQPLQPPILLSPTNQKLQAEKKVSSDD